MMTDKPRVLYLVHNFDNLAGVEIHTKTLWQGLNQQFDTFIVHPEQTGPRESQLVLRSSAGEILRFPADPVPWPIAPYNMARNEASLKKILEHVAPDLIHIQHFIHWPLSVIDQCNAFGVPVFISFHDYFVFTPQFTMLGIADPLEAVTPAASMRHFGADISEYLGKRLEYVGRGIAQAHKLITPAPYLARLINKVFQRSPEVIEIGIEPFSPPARRPEVEQSKIKFGYVGSMIPQKGWDLLAQAFVQVHKLYPGTELLMFGGGSPPPLNFPGVRFLGGYKPDDLPGIMAQFDVGVIPSIFAETFSMLLSEMWLARKPAAVSDIGALGERVQDGVNGKKFRAGDIADLVRALVWFVENDDWRDWTLPKPRLAAEMIAQYRTTYIQTITGTKY